MVSDLDKNFVGWTDLAKKARTGGFAYPYSPPSFPNSPVFLPPQKPTKADMTFYLNLVHFTTVKIFYKHALLLALPLYKLI